MNCSALAAAPDPTTKSGVEFATMPVGWKGVPPGPEGRSTTSAEPAGWGTPLPSYCVEVLVPLLAMAPADPGAKTIAHGSTRCGSTVTAAVPAVSATSSRKANTEELTTSVYERESLIGAGAVS